MRVTWLREGERLVDLLVLLTCAIATAAAFLIPGWDPPKAWDRSSVWLYL